MKLYESKWSRALMRMLSIVGIFLCLFFVLVGTFKISPIFEQWKVLEPQVVLIMLGVWLISLLLNNLSEIDKAQKQEEY